MLECTATKTNSHSKAYLNAARLVANAARVMGDFTRVVALLLHNHTLEANAVDSPILVLVLVARL